MFIAHDCDKKHTQLGLELSGVKIVVKVNNEVFNVSLCLGVNTIFEYLLSHFCAYCVVQRFVCGYIIAIASWLVWADNKHLALKYVRKSNYIHPIFDILLSTINC